MSPEEMKQLNSAIRPMIDDAVSREVVKRTNSLEKKIDTLSASIATVIDELRDLQKSLGGNGLDSPGVVKRVEDLEKDCAELAYHKKTLIEMAEQYKAVKILIGLIGSATLVQVVEFIINIYHRYGG